MLRPVMPEDAHTIAFHRYPEDVDAAERPIYAQWVNGAVQRGSYLGFLRDLSGEVVCGAGLILLEWGPSRGDAQAYRARLVNVWTHPQHRRQGLAGQAVTACLNLAAQQGLQVVTLGTTAMGRSLYHRLGFQASETEMYLKLR